MSRPHIALDICTITYIHTILFNNKDITIIPIPNIQNFLGIYRRRLIGRKVINMY